MKKTIESRKTRKQIDQTKHIDLGGAIQKRTSNIKFHAKNYATIRFRPILTFDFSSSEIVNRFRNYFALGNLCFDFCLQGFDGLQQMIPSLGLL